MRACTKVTRPDLWTSGKGTSRAQHSDLTRLVCSSKGTIGVWEENQSEHALLSNASIFLDFSLMQRQDDKEICGWWVCIYNHLEANGQWRRKRRSMENNGWVSWDPCFACWSLAILNGVVHFEQVTIAMKLCSTKLCGKSPLSIGVSLSMLQR